MFCAQCGNALSPGAASCTACSATGVAATAPAPSQASERVKARSQDALKVFRMIAVNPVGQLSSAFASMEKRQAMEVGVVFAGVFEVCAVIGLFLMLPRWAGSPGLGEILKIIILGVVPFVAITGAGTVARQIFRGTTGSFESDVFIAGVSVLPFGFVALLSGVLGLANMEVTAIAAIFALSYMILILFTGCTRISGISESHAALAVPIIVLLGGWLSKILFAAML